MHPQGKECREPWKTAQHEEEAKEEPAESTRGRVALSTPGFQTAGTQNCNTRHFCCSDPPTFQCFVTAALGNQQQWRHLFTVQLAIIESLKCGLILKAKLRQQSENLFLECPLEQLGKAYGSLVRIKFLTNNKLTQLYQNNYQNFEKPTIFVMQ